MAFELGPDGLYHLQLTPDDERLGKLNPDGSIARWPLVNIFGAPVDRNVATLRGVPGGFVVVPPLADHLLDITVGSAPVISVRKAEKPAEKPE